MGVMELFAGRPFRPAGIVCAVVLALSTGQRLGGEEPHWAYRPLVRPPVPAVNQDPWPRGAVDRFTLAAMRRRGLRPKREALGAVLVRRLSLDLTGLPPTGEELAAYRADSGPGGYGRLVERLLASPRFGERMAVPWLDAARYADTHGYHMDAHREMWRWRDWVIDSLNSNMPFDQFTIEQLAGDLLPSASLAQRIATGFNRNHMINFEDGSIAEEFRTEYVVDRVVTTATVWLGQTMACCRCHDHKYDPLTQHDFYRLFAFFNQVPENGIDGAHGNALPTVKAPAAFQQQQLTRLERRIADLKRQLRRRRAAVTEAVETWQKTALRGAGKPLSKPPIWQLTGDEAWDGEALPAATLVGNRFVVAGKIGNGLLFDGETHVVAEASHGWRLRDRFSLAAWVFPTTRDRMQLAAKMDRGQRGFELQLVAGHPELRVSTNPSAHEFRVRSTTTLELRKWQHLVVTYDGAARDARVRMLLDGKELSTEVLNAALPAPFQNEARLKIGGAGQAGFRGMLDEVQVFDRSLSVLEASDLAGIRRLDQILASGGTAGTSERQALLHEYYLEHVDQPYQRLQAELARCRDQLHDLNAAVPSVMVMQDLQPRITYLLEGGQYDQRREVVTAGTPAVLPPMSEAWPRNRLGLARWIVHASNPLTARVAANRIWQLYFGQGLVTTPDDFGVRGQPPSHPGLLDWLAAELIESGWDRKHLHRLIVTSATYRQSSRLAAPDMTADRRNVWLSRGPAYRLPAEIVRDSALRISGLLVEQLGGRSVFPYQPPGLWKPLAFDPDEFTAQVYRPDQGRDLYRRSLYTFWKRSVPPPPLEAFGAPSRETCTVRRQRIDTPQQALVLMNEPTFVEAARNFAEQILQRGGAGTRQRLEYAFRRATGRLPTASESQVLARLLAAQLNQYSQSPAAAAGLLRVGGSRLHSRQDPAELAAWTTVASVILSMDAVIRKY